MGTYTRGTWPLALFVLFANPLVAQDKDPPLKMVYAVWKDIGGAAYTVTQMNKKNYDKVEAWAVIVKDSTGKVEVTQRGNKAGGSARAMQASVIIDTAVARLGALPANAGENASQYRPASGPASRLSEGDLKKVVSMLHPNESALLAISPKPDVADVEKFMGMGGHGTPEKVVIDLQQ